MERRSHPQANLIGLPVNDMDNLLPRRNDDGYFLAALMVSKFGLFRANSSSCANFKAIAEMLSLNCSSPIGFPG